MRRFTAPILLIGLFGATNASAQFSSPPSARPSQPPLAPAPTLPLPSASPINDCSAAYYRALEPVRAGRGVVLAGLHRALRTPDPELPGKWQINAPLTSKQKPPPKPERVCVEMKEIGGRAPRCVRFETKPAVVPPDVLARLPATADEARVLKAIGEFVEAKGALPDVGNNGRYNFLVQRLAQDIRLYVGQPPHANLCAGASDLIEFYGHQVVPLKKRMDEVTVLAKQARDLADVRVRAIAVVEMKNYDLAVAEVAKIEAQRAKLLATHAAEVAKAAQTGAAATEGTAATRLPTAPLLPNIPPLPPRPNVAAQLSDYAIVSLPALLSEALRPLLPPAKIMSIADEPIPLKALAKARAALLSPETERSAATPDVRDAALMALRLLEARMYSDLYVARFKDMDAALFGALVDLRKAQSSACTCQE